MRLTSLSGVEEDLVEIYLTGISARRAEDIAEALWGIKVLQATISGLNKTTSIRVEETGAIGTYRASFTHIFYVDEVCPRRNWGREFENVAGPSGATRSISRIYMDRKHLEAAFEDTSDIAADFMHTGACKPFCETFLT